MQQLRMKDIQTLLQGELLNDSKQWIVKYAIYYNRHDLTDTYTLEEQSTIYDLSCYFQ
ncbi:hypothetical protein ACIQ2D_08130 [Lysinibacillus sp. NPDC097287]|uniref:hypothetical protein n=1 Tax=Lysinibacillus sp. NPDC097287 TaxID=3364144 RepID=UPI003805B7C7